MVQISNTIQKYFEDLKKGCNNLIDAKSLYDKVSARENLFLLDIRKKDDFAKNYIEGSVHCEWGDVIEFIEEDILPRDKKIVVICYTGQTAGQTVGILKALGYDACSLMGGMVNGWLKNSMPVEAACST